MSGFKGLIPKSLLTDEGLNPLLKKSEEYRKVGQCSEDVVTSINKVFQAHLHQVDRVIELSCFDSRQEQYYASLISKYTEVHEIDRQFFEQCVSLPANQLTLQQSTNYINFSGVILTFQQQLKSYSITEAASQQLSRKYFKDQKYLLNSIEAYKQSFQEAKLIYNTKQKIKRYSACEQYYQATDQDLSSLKLTCGKLEENKVQIVKTYEKIEKYLEDIQISLNVKLFNFLAHFKIDFSRCLNRKVKKVRENKGKLENMEIGQFFEAQMPISWRAERQIRRITFMEYINNVYETIVEQKCNSREKISSLLAALENFIDYHKNNHKKIYDFHAEYYRTIEKNYLPSLKENLQFLEKNKKKYKQLFLQSNYEQVKVVIELYRNLYGVYDNLTKRVNSRMVKISENLQEMNKILKMALIEVKTHIDRTVKDKQVDKYEIQGSVKFIIHLISGFDEKIFKNLENFKKYYNHILNDVQMCFSEMESLSDDHELNPDQIGIKILEMRREKLNRLKGLAFSDLYKDELKVAVSFSGDSEKNEDFKKLKKPIEVNVSVSANEPPEQNDEEEICESPIKQKYKRHLQFLQTKIKFLEKQELLKTFNCALADKIILQGKLYVTNHRLCFFSNFNADNVFFGQTFLQIPKKDIKTMEKRKNGIFFDNSISLTTINGEVFLTSFMKRNQAFKLISELIGLKHEQCAYIAEESHSSDVDHSNIKQKFENSQHIQIEEIQITECFDDLKQCEIGERQQKIQAMLQNQYNFKQCASAQFYSEKLTALVMLKQFILDNEVTIQRKKYSNFGEYFKKVILLHKDIEWVSFEPNVTQFLNPHNIKSSCPLKTTSKYSCTIPIVKSGIPFMPKFAKSVQIQNLYIVSKDKWIIESVIENSGAPYTDCFTINFRTVCESSASVCKIQSKIYLNFFKTVMMKSIIESKSQEQSAIQLKRQYEEYKKHLSHLAEEKKKKSKMLQHSMSMNPRMEEQSEQVKEQYEQRIEKLEQTIERVMKQKQALMQSHRVESIRYKFALLSAVALYLVSILMLYVM